MTEEGMRRLALAEAFKLDKFYNEYVGNILIPELEMNADLFWRVTVFLRNNPDWVLGFEQGDGAGCGCWWLNTAEDAVL